MLSKILITGGKERQNGFQLGEGKYYEEANLLKLDINTGTFEKILSFSEGGENYPDEYPNLEYTAGCVEGSRLWLSTDTEVMLYDYPSMQLLKKASYPAFHNIHHVQAFNNYIAVASTGLDMVIILSKDKLKPLKYINVQGENPWHRFSPSVDYRKIHSTRPHDSHPNYIFELNGELWVTRCTQEDAVNLSNISQAIDIAPLKSISVHDGHVINGNIYFTTVDGFIVIVDALSLKIKEEIDLNKFETRRNSKGWCRGIHVDGDIIYVGFSRFRKTRNQKKIEWLKNLSGQSNSSTNAVVAAYHMNRREKLNEWILPDNTIDAIYCLLPEPKL